MILAGDIGGTKTNLGFFAFENNKLKCLIEETFTNEEHSSFNDIVLQFVESHDLKIATACFGIAGPIRNGRCELTNLSWVLDTKELARDLKVKETHIINDLEANAYGINALSPSDLFVLNPGNPGNKGNTAVIAAGTGLGEAGLYWDGQRYNPYACEGGHVEFGPRNKLELELLGYLLDKLPHVSYEWVISGVGIYNIYQFLRDTGDYGKEAPWFTKEILQRDTGVVITQAALQKRCTICIKTLEMFTSIYGAEAGNLALKTMALSGIYVGGGIAPNILPFLKSGLFMEAFTHKGRLSHIVESIPVKVILTTKTALLGAALCAARKSKK